MSWSPRRPASRQTSRRRRRNSSTGVDENEPQIAVFIEANYVAAVIRLRSFDDTFLYVARLLDPRVVAQLRQTQASVAEYAALESRKLGIQVAFALMFAVIALTILMASVLIGLNFANWLVAPIRRSDGRGQHRLDRRSACPGSRAEIGRRSRPVRRDLQQDDAGAAHPARRAGQRQRTVDSRRRFIEAVLSSASAGIIGVDASGSIGILNRSAEKLIGQAESEVLDHPLSEVLPELDDMMKTAREGTQKLVQGQITITRDGHESNLSVRVSAEQTSQSRDSYIITLDDITDLVSAQRTSAWGDVARRIAHEIKNPLTPIQLSAERIRRKFGKVIDRRQGHLRAMHRHHRAPGRRHQAHGRRVLALCADAEAGHGRRGRRRYRAAGGVPDEGRPSRPRYRGRHQAGSDAGAVRPPADLAGAHQHHQERDRGDRAGAAGGARQGPHRCHRRAGGRRHRDRRHRQRHRPAKGRRASACWSPM